MTKTTETETETKTKSPFYEELIKGNTKKFAVKKAKNILFEMAKIDPMEAKHILRYHNKNNRKPSKVVVTKYATDMINKDWLQSGQPIAFDKNGNLIDGQQRLLAVLTTKLPQDFAIVYGLESEAFSVIDNGKVKSPADIIGKDGHEDSVLLASLARSIIAFQGNGNVDANISLQGLNQITKSQTLTFIRANPKIKEYLNRYKTSRIVTPAVAAFCYWALSQVNQPKAEEMLDKVFLGLDLQKDTIEHYLHDKLTRNRNAIQNKLTKTAIISNVFLCWRRVMGWSTSKTMHLKWDARGNIPKITK